jgi:hypothetical protein
MEEGRKSGSEAFFIRKYERCFRKTLASLKNSSVYLSSKVETVLKNRPSSIGATVFSAFTSNNSCRLFVNFYISFSALDPAADFACDKSPSMAMFLLHDEEAKTTPTRRSLK